MKAKLSKPAPTRNLSSAAAFIRDCMRFSFRPGNREYEREILGFRPRSVGVPVQQCSMQSDLKNNQRPDNARCCVRGRAHSAKQSLNPLIRVALRGELKKHSVTLCVRKF